MNPQKIIKKYVLPKGQSVAAIVLIIASLVCAVMGIAAMGGADDTALEFYPSESETGSMAYIDVVGISGWVYKYDEAVYYTALDGEGYLYTVRLSDSQFKQLSAQNAYWEDDSADAVPPASFRLEGLVKDTASDTRRSIAQAWVLTTAEYDKIFGTKFLDATTSAGEEASAPWFVGTLFFGMLGLVFLIAAGRSKRNAKKCLQVLEERGLLERAADQLENPNTHMVIGKNRGILTQDFLFGKGTGMVVAYSDIHYAYQHDRKRNFVPVNSYLMVGTMATAVEAAVELNRADKKGAIAQAIMVIAQRNPHAMIGYSKDNDKAFAAIRRG